MDHFLTEANLVWNDGVHYVALVVFVCAVFNAVLPPALSATDTWDKKNALTNLINRVRQSKYYTCFRYAITMGAFAFLWAKNFSDPKQREAVEKIVAPLVALLASLDQQAGIDPSTITSQVGGPTVDTTPSTDSTSSTVSYTLSGPILSGINETLKTIGSTISVDTASK